MHPESAHNPQPPFSSIAVTHASISQRVYRGDIDTPKTDKSKRKAGLPKGLRQDIAEWLTASPDTGPDGWLFPSENLKTPLAKDNVWRRNIAPTLKAIGLGWVNFQVASVALVIDARSQC